jgi:hypothetical protein
MAVEWMRSCYSSQWYLFKDSRTTVWGRYYRVHADKKGIPLVPFYPGPHLFGSQRWWEKNFQLEQPELGELISARQQWDNGSPQFPLPEAVTVGSASCLVDGESIGEALTPDSPLRDGSYPVQCYVIPPIDPIEWGFNVYRCPVQLWWLQRLWELDNGFRGNLAAEVAVKFPDAQVFFPRPQRLLPPTCLIVSPRYAVILFSPTQNGEQALIEVIEGILGPVDMGGFSTANLWYQQSERGLIRLSDHGVTINTPLLCVGYSYGGACAQIAAAIARLGNANRLVRWLSFGAPRAGDDRMQALLGLPTRGCGLANDDDIITAIPPDVDVIPGLRLVLGDAVLAWNRWQPARETWKLFHDGHVEENAYPVPTVAEMVTLFLHVVGTGTFFGIPAHSLIEYEQRLFRRCPVRQAVGDGAMGLGGGPELLGLNAPDVHAFDRLALFGPAARLGAGRLGMRSVPPVPARGYLGMAGRRAGKGLLSLWGGLPRIGVVGLEGKALGSGRLGVFGQDAGTGQLGLSAKDVGRGKLGLAKGVQLPAISYQATANGSSTTAVTSYTTPKFTPASGKLLITVASFSTTFQSSAPTITLNGTSVPAQQNTTFSMTGFFGILTFYEVSSPAVLSSIAITPAVSSLLLWSCTVVENLWYSSLDITPSIWNASGASSTPALGFETLTANGAEYVYAAYGFFSTTVPGWMSPMISLGQDETGTLSHQACGLSSGYLITSNAGRYAPSANISVVTAWAMMGESWY